jgi:4-diphosphocytidyl-2-C-methyl-D-erythritol kinase
LHNLADAVAQALSGGSALETAPAKINLALHVLSRRSDGFHNIDSLVVFTELADLVSAVPSRSANMDLALDGEFAGELDLLCRPSGNLVLRAAEAMRLASGKRRLPAAQLVLTKRVPIAAGLGGGSADAAATLRLLNRHWGLGLSDKQLTKIGRELGADVPMCLASRPVVANGIGERLAPAAGIPPLPLVLVNPSIPLSTASVYRQLDNAERSPMPPMPASFGSVIAFVIWLRQTRNDLSIPAKAVTGLAERAVKTLSSDPECLFARMSGSGATAFGIFAKMSNAERAAERIRLKRPNWWVVATEAKGS